MSTPLDNDPNNDSVSESAAKDPLHKTVEEATSATKQPGENVRSDSESTSVVNEVESGSQTEQSQPEEPQAKQLESEETEAEHSEDIEDKNKAEEPVDKRFFKTKTSIFLALVTLVSAFAGLIVFMPLSAMTLQLSTTFGIAHILSFSSLVAYIGFLFTALLLIPTIVALVRLGHEGRQTIIMGFIASLALGATSTALYLNPTGSMVEQNIASPTSLFTGHDFSHLPGEKLEDFLTDAITNRKPYDPQAKVPPSRINVAEFNSYNKLSTEDLHELMKYEPAIVVLPETTAEAVLAALDALPKEINGRPVQNYALFTTPQHNAIAPTSVLVSDILGPYEETTTSEDEVGFGTVKIEPVGEDRYGRWPVIFGLHNAPPLPGLMDQWQADINKLPIFGECANAGASKRIIMAGDLNATLRHGPLAAMSGCWDVMDQVGKGNMGTWPSSLRPEFAAPIDHIIVHGAITSTLGRAVELGDSDHRALIVQLAMGAQEGE